MPLCCVECKPCNGGHCQPVPGPLFKSRRPAHRLRRALGKMKLGGTRRRPRRPGSFRSVRAVFWPLISMRSEADARNNDDDARPPTDSSPDDTFRIVGAPGGAALETAAPVLTLQARPGGEAGEAPRAPPPQLLLMAAGEDDEAKAIVVRHGGGNVEEACRSFERHLVEMLVEERKVMDLTDVEELLCCWEKLTCPAFVRLVGRFYGELCMDLYSSAQDADDDDVWPYYDSEDMGNPIVQRPFFHEPMTHQAATA